MSEKMTDQQVIENYLSMQVHADMERQLFEIKADYPDASRGDKMKLTRQIKEMEAKIEGYRKTFEYVQIMTAKRVVERVVEQLQKIQEDYKTALAKFIERAQENPEDAIAWRGNYIVANQEQVRYATLLLEVMNACDNEEQMVQRYLEEYEHIKKEITRQVLANARRGSSRSTSGFHNIVEQAKMEGMAEFLDNWRLGEVEYYVDAINNHKILKEAGLLTEE